MELYWTSDCGSDSSASEVDVVSPLDSFQVSYFTVQNNKATSWYSSSYKTWELSQVNRSQ